MYKEYLNIIDERAEEFCAVSDALWDNPEIPYGEFEAAKLLTAKLEEIGFTVERGVAGIPLPLPPHTAQESPSWASWRSMTAFPA